MHFISTLALAAATLSTAVSAANFSVIVGQNNANIYEPNQLTGVQSGDFVSFKFVSKNHTVTQSTFTDPCTLKPSGVNSGYIPANASAGNTPEWTIQIDNATAPLWFFCEQGPHCKLGMVFAINPTAEKSFATFQSTAMGTTTGTTGTTGTAGTAGTTGTTGTTGTAGTAGTTTGGTTVVGASDTNGTSNPATGAQAPASGALSLSAQSAASLVGVVGALLALVL